MKLPHRLRYLFATSAVLLCSAMAQAQITFQGKEGPGKGKKIVLLAGDEEYRSEEVLPMFARLLAEKHGFTTTVLFSVNEAGEIEPGKNDSVTGSEALKEADLVITMLRFRNWPDQSLKHFQDYYLSGKPFIGLRTSTHAFAGIKGEYASLNSFGKNVLGEQWVTHWGEHKKQATLGHIEKGSESDPILRGVEQVFGDTDVYEAYPPKEAKILVRGEVLKGMTADSGSADYEKTRASDKQKQPVNSPMMPVVWTLNHTNPAGRTNKVLTTTMGAATDFQNESLRRIVVNGAYVLTGLEVPAKAEVEIIGDYPGTMYGFKGHIQGVKPADIPEHGFSKGKPPAKK